MQTHILFLFVVTTEVISYNNDRAEKQMFWYCGYINAIYGAVANNVSF